MEVDGGLDAQGNPQVYDFTTSYPSNGAPTLALLLTGRVDPVALAYEMGDRTSIPPYDFPHLRVTIEDMAPIVRASWMRGVSALPNTFAHESYMDELAHAAGVDPVEYRLRYIQDDRAAELMRHRCARRLDAAHRHSADRQRTRHFARTRFCLRTLSQQISRLRCRLAGSRMSRLISRAARSPLRASPWAMMPA